MRQGLILVYAIDNTQKIMFIAQIGHKKSGDLVIMSEIIKQENIEISSIIRDEKLQPRVSMDSGTIEEYATAMRNGEDFPAVTIFYDGKKYWLSDGWHRVEAAISAGRTDISAEIRSGTFEDALKNSLSSNATHGLKRSQADKKRAIINALNAFPLESNREIARIVHVDDKTVGKYREELKIQQKEESMDHLLSWLGIGQDEKTIEVILSLFDQHECIMGLDRYNDQLMATLVNLDDGCFWFEGVNLESNSACNTIRGFTIDKTGFNALRIMLRKTEFEISNFDWVPRDDCAEEYRKMAHELHMQHVLGIE